MVGGEKSLNESNFQITINKVGEYFTASITWLYKKLERHGLIFYILRQYLVCIKTPVYFVLKKAFYILRLLYSSFAYVSLL
jgi:hypothetical protein